MLAEHSFLPHVPLAPEPTAPFKALEVWVQGGALWHLHCYFQTTVALCLHSASEPFANRLSLQFLNAPLGPPQGHPPHPALLSPEGRPFCSRPSPHHGGYSKH